MKNFIVESGDFITTSGIYRMSARGKSRQTAGEQVGGF
jgi:hypothetical protein